MPIVLELDRYERVFKAANGTLIGVILWSRTSGLDAMQEGAKSEDFREGDGGLPLEDPKGPLGVLGQRKVALFSCQGEEPFFQARGTYPHNHFLGMEVAAQVVFSIVIHADERGERQDGNRGSLSWGEEKIEEEQVLVEKKRQMEREGCCYI